ncbi:MAG: hypothetical protein ACRDT6_27040, partial [Micromonosporaceae bacterium]
GTPGPGDRREEALAALAGETDSLEDTASLEVTAVSPAVPEPAADAEPDSDPDVPLWPGASPAPAGIPQKRTVVRTRPRPPVAAARQAPRLYRPTRRPAVGLPLLVLLGLLALFVAWVSAEPFWLAVGHHDTGAVQLTRCTGSGTLGTRCVGTFSAEDRRYAVDLASVSGVATEDREVGRTLPARMVSEDGRIAYAGDPVGLHLRWLLGLVLLLVLGLGICAATGAWRLTGAARAGAVSAGLLAPLLLAALMLALTY